MQGDESVKGFLPVSARKGDMRPHVDRSTA
jgi:hypothetical protein